MSVLMAERVDQPLSLFGPPAVDAPAVEHDEGPGGRLTLDDAIVGVWEGLVARAVVACPLCGGSMRSLAAPGRADAHGGRCRDCGTTLG
jgi:tRNA(Ile2) C34 agmatinyltransferase TiaS